MVGGRAMRESEFTITHKNRTFIGICLSEVDSDGYMIKCDIKLLCWYSLSNGVGYFHEVEWCDRNWLRVNKLLAEIELMMRKKNLN
jgi:hypothetical protein